MNEVGFKRYIKNGMRMRWKHQHIESGGTGLGIPDTYFSMEGIGGWVEFKYLSRWPVRSTTVVKIYTLKPEQKLWLLLHGRLTGHVFLFLKVGKDDYLLYDCHKAQHLGNYTKEGMIRNAMGTWKKSVNFIELSELLRKGY